MARPLLLLLLPYASAVPLATICPRRSGRPPTQLLAAKGSGESESVGKVESWWAKRSGGFKGFGAKAAVDPDRTKAMSLLKKRGLSNAGQAQKLLRSALQRDPMNVDIKLELAEAINMEVRIRTNANSLVLEGVQDSPAFKKIWRTMGGESYALASEARKAYPRDIKVLAVYADAFLYTTSAKGILKQALTGAGKKYLSIAKELYKYPDWDAAVGCSFLGGFYNCAPWPVGNKNKARKFLREGAKIAPTRRNLYYAGVNAYQMGDFADAKSFFARALKAAPCKTPSSTEDDFFGFVLQEARRGLKLSEEELSKAE